MTESEVDLLRHFASFSPFPRDSLYPSDSPDSAYGSLSLSDLLPGSDSLESQPHSPARVLGEESLSEQGSDSGVSDLSAGFRELTPEPTLVQRHKAQSRGRHRRQQVSRDTGTPASRVSVTPAGKDSVTPAASWSYYVPLGLSLLALLLTLWLGNHVKCCHSVCAIHISPILHFTNGPPPL